MSDDERLHVKCKTYVGEKWCNSYLIQYLVSYDYNGGTVIKDQWYKGYVVPEPQLKEGYKLQGIGCGLQLNARPPYATAMLVADDGHDISRGEAGEAIDENKSTEDRKQAIPGNQALSIHR